MTTQTTEMRFPATIEEVIAKRDNYLAGLDSRINWERENAGADDDAQRELASIVEYLSGARVRGTRRDGSNADAFTLGYAVGRGINFPDLFLDKRVDGARCNVYAIPKMLAFMRVLNGAKFRDDSDDNTNCATVLALASKLTGGKRMWDHINETCSAFGMSGGRYGSGATQGGSSLRALAALGIVRKEGNAHVICDDDMFAILVKAAKARAKAGK